jgi:hypothetical protein
MYCRVSSIIRGLSSLSGRLNNNSDNSAKDKTTHEQLNRIRNEVKHAYSEGKINEKHYGLLDKDILDLYNEQR